MMKKPELLSPAGSMKAMQHAFAYGADAVYAGQPKYSLRTRNNEFKQPVLAEGIAAAHAMGKKFYVAVNLLPHNAKVKTFMADLKPIIDMQPDALIMADPGLIMMVRETYPDMPIHLSVQMNTVNYASVKFWQSMGLERIILSRELSLNEIEEIRQQCPDMELEVFVHGALCIAYSGRCLLSGYFNHRDSNQGVCTNACRWEYKTVGANENAEGNYVAETLPLDALNEAQGYSCCGDQPRHPAADRVYYLEEKQRPGELMPVFEDEHGTYIMNSKDLRAIEHVERLVKMGIDCLKIEGRTKSHYYVARTAQAYRQAIDAAAAGQTLDPKLIGMLENLANRGYTDGFYQRHHAQDHQNYITGASRSHQQQFVGERLAGSSEPGWMKIDVKNKFVVGDTVEFVIGNGQNQNHKITAMRDEKGRVIDTAPGAGHIVHIPDHGIAQDMVLLARYL